MMFCPWCEQWSPIETYTKLQMPPNHRSECSQIYKHGGPDGCKYLFSLRHG